MTVSIIGAGICGMTAAIALQQKGFDAQIYEQSEELKPVGAGIILANNAMQVYKKLGLKSEIERLGNPINSMNITGMDLNPFSNVNLRKFEQIYGCQNIAIHRGQLQQILMKHIIKGSLHVGHKLIEVQSGNGINLLKFQYDKEIQSPIVLGADGINSTVRKHIFPNSRIRNAYQLCWRGIVDFELPENTGNESYEAWGQGDRFGFVQIAPKKVYWYAVKSFKDSESEIPLKQLGLLYKGYNQIVNEIISRTEHENIHTGIITDLKPLKKWYRGNLCLMGDAAHATTPNMGQGACQAIEDAYIFSECFDRFEIEKSFAAFQKLRMSKVQKIVNTSWRIGKMAHWKHPLVVRIRNQIIKLSPESLSEKQFEKIFEV